jgi:hypothetical protein
MAILVSILDMLNYICNFLLMIFSSPYNNSSFTESNATSITLSIS